MRMSIAAVALLTLAAFAQGAIPVFIGPVINFLPPALDAAGQTVAFASTVDPNGAVENTSNLYVGSSKLVPNVTSVGLTSDGSHAVFTDAVTNGEGVGTVDISSGVIQRMNVDTSGCVRPLALCAACFFSCVATPHPTVDGSRVLFMVRRNQPFLVMNADGTNLARLPVFTGALAPSPQRVISTSGLVVFTSAAPAGPTFAAAATDVYLMNLDGSNVRNLTKFGNSQIFANNATMSADGNTVVFESNYAGANAPPSQQTAIWEVHADGSGLRLLTPGTALAAHPSISAGGETIAFVESGQIYVSRFGATPLAVTSFRYSAAQSPVVSDNGQTISFLVGPAASSGAGAVYRINSDGTNLQPVYAPRAISPRGVVSAAGFSLPPSPGGLLTIYGINFSSDTVSNASGFPLPQTLAGVSALAGGIELPLLSVSPWQINAQLPQQNPLANVDFQITFGDGTTTALESAGVVAAAPDLFTASFANGQVVEYQAAAYHAGTSVLADDNHPAHAGEMLEMYGTGLGVTDPPVAAGQPSPSNPVARANLTPVVMIGDVAAKVTFAGLTPGLAGVYQVNIVVPDGLAPGRYPVIIQGTNGNQGGQGGIAVAAQ